MSTPLASFSPWEHPVRSCRARRRTPCIPSFLLLLPLFLLQLVQQVVYASVLIVSTGAAGSFLAEPGKESFCIPSCLCLVYVFSFQGANRERCPPPCSLFLPSEPKPPFLNSLEKDFLGPFLLHLLLLQRTSTASCLRLCPSSFLRLEAHPSPLLKSL